MEEKISNKEKLNVSNDQQFRIYDSAPEHVKNFYKQNHEKQTYEYVTSLKQEIYPLQKYKTTFKELENIVLNIVDDSDPDFIAGSQLIHNIYAAEACRILFPDEDWMHLVGFLHDYGKILMHHEFYNLPSWLVVGDTFPVGCAYSNKIVYYDYLKSNPDYKNQLYQTDLGVYEKNCGFDNVHFSFSHDEFMYQFLKANQKGTHKIPEEGLYIIRYHSFYPWHQNQEYSYLANQYDWDMLPRLREFQTADLYLKQRKTDQEELLKLLPYYQRLIEKYVCPINEEVIL
jgi:inositol oxygenase